jgi:hephaestin
MSAFVLAASRVFAERSPLISPPLRKVALAGAAQAFAAVLALVLLHSGGGTAVGHHAVAQATGPAPLVHLLRDGLLAVPLSIAVLIVATALADRLVGRTGHARATWATAGAVTFAVAMIPAALVHGQLFDEIPVGVSPVAHAVTESGVALLVAFAVLMAMGPPKSLRISGARLCAIGATAGLLAGLAATVSVGGAAAQTVPTQTRTYYIAADEVEWDYAPQRRNLITGEAFNEDEQVFTEHSDTRIGTVYKKALYREYTDSTFRKLKARSDRDKHLGILGPMIRANVGDTIRVVFKNKARFPFSVHPHGVFYPKSAEGAPYSDGTGGGNKADDAVAPGATFTYTWAVPERAGPGPGDGATAMWMYHSHVNEVKDTNSGLVGPMIIGRRGAPDGNGFDRELTSLFTVFNENESHYLDENIADRAPNADPEDEDFQEHNLKHAINGFIYGNTPDGRNSDEPLFTTRLGERVRWYNHALGTEVDLHSPHWHGHTLLSMGSRIDVTELLPGSMKMADLIPDDPGIWLYHCHVNDHILAGMQARYEVR